MTSMKKIFTFVIAMLIALSAVSPVCLAKSDSETNGMVLNYEYDFSLGQLYWQTNQTMIKDQAVQMRSDWCEVQLPAGISWKNYVMEFDYHLDDFSTTAPSGWFMVPMKGYRLLMRNGGGVWLYNETVGESELGESFTLRKNGDYHFKVVAKNDTLKAYVSGTGLPREKELLNITGNEGVGNLKFTGYFRAAIDNIKVYVDPNEDYVAKEKIKMVKVADTTKMEFIKESKNNVVWESANPEIASISDDGTILAEKPGFAVIKALDKNGKELENMGVYVYEPVAKIEFEDAGREDRPVYVGDTIGLNLKLGPSNSASVFEWSVNDEKFGEFYGSSSKRRSFTALSAGEAEIRVKDRLSGEEAILSLTIQPERPKDKQGNTVFYETGVTHEIHSEIAGFHYGSKNSSKIESEEVVEILKTVKPQSMRNEQSLMNDAAAQEDWKTYLDANPVWDYSNHLGVKQFVFCTSHLDTPEEILEQVKYIRENLNPEIELVVECANESYAMQFEKTFPRAKDYFEWAKEVSIAIKGWNKDVKVVAAAVEGGTETNILSDKNNLDAMQKDNWAYTQGDRIVEWNSTLAEYKDYFDGMTAHDYMSTEFGEIISAEEFIRMAYAWCESQLKCDLNILSRTDFALPYYYTEWGVLAANMFWAGGMSDDDKIRYQWQPYPVTAIKNMEQMMDWLSTGYVASGSNHYMRDSQGFGTFVGQNLYAPNYYVMKKTAELTTENDTYYELYAPNAGSYVMSRPWYHGKDKNIAVNNIKAWGMGDKNSLKNVVVANHTNVPQTFSIAGAKLKQTWQYGGSVDELMIDWMKNEKYTSYLYNDGWDLTHIPEEIQNAKFSNEIVIKPYSIMVLDVEGTPEKLENTSIGKVSQYAQIVLEDGLALKIGDSRAYKSNVQVQVDSENANVVPKIKNDRTLLPLRFVSESFGCDVQYDDETKEIKISDDEIDIALTVGETKYTVNGNEYQFDVPAEVEEGRTFVPLRALVEALGKEVYWDQRGVIMIYPPKTGWTSGQQWLDETLKPDIDTVVALFD